MTENAGVLLFADSEKKIGCPSHVPICAIQYCKPELIRIFLLSPRKAHFRNAQAMSNHVAYRAVRSEKSGGNGHEDKRSAQPPEMVTVGIVANFVTYNIGQFVFRCHLVQQTGENDNVPPRHGQRINGVSLLDVDLKIIREFSAVTLNGIQKGLQLALFFRKVCLLLYLGSYSRLKWP